jgi:uncharacterized protein YndB with AHSA1/START domain
LFDTLLAEVREPWQVCEVEGDAIFAYAPEGTIVQGQTLLEVVENLYTAFARSRDQMQRNTTCTCTACQLISTLDIKFVAHFGTFVLQRLAGQSARRPSGPDVILVHRLLKNTIKERTGISAYAFVSEASVNALDLQEVASHLTGHSELYSHLGRVEGYVYDLHPFWAREKAKRRDLVQKDDSWISLECDVSAPPQIVWEYLHEPERKRKWRNADEVRMFGLSGGRMGLGTTQHCVHGNMVIAELVVDWRPFSYFTCQAQWPLKAMTRSTTYLAPSDAGTHVTTCIQKPGGRNALHNVVAALAYGLMRRSVVQDHTMSMDRLRELVENEAVREPAAVAHPATP